ncbi:MAG: polyphosphate kinase 1 [Clostridia bacterium]|nr:polyphosphate kinase 1 [Clostridia bacterium]
MNETEPLWSPAQEEETPVQEPAAAPVPTPKVPRQLCFLNRELSWLKFNERVLEEAADEHNPLCERMTFLSIFQTNLDEFFMVRVGSLHDMMLLKNEIRENKTNMTPMEQVSAVLREVRSLLPKKEAVYHTLLSAMEHQGISLVTFADLNSTEKKYLEKYFTKEVEPLLSTVVVGRKQPFPFLNNKDLYAVAELGKKNDKEKVGIVPCSSGVIQRLIPIPGRMGCYILSEELILHFLSKVFKKYGVKSKAIIRVTRNADIDADSVVDEDLDYREHMAEVIRQRRKLCPVRLEMSRPMDERITTWLCDRLGLTHEQVFLSKMPADLSFVFAMQDTLRSSPDLFYERRVPQRPAGIEPGRSMIEQIKEKDRMLSLPFESVNPFLQLLNEAARDPQVVSIRMTLYRLAKHSKVVEALTEAAENGKQVDVLVELKARFDEENNIEWSRRLEDAGCHVIYGIDKLKVHSKLCLITRRGENGVEYITQVGTGNYNEKTARLYTDLQLMTADPAIGREAAEVFSALSLGEVVEKTEHLLVAPKCLQGKILDMFDEQIALAEKGQPAYVGLKLNSLTDKRIMDKMIEASQAGVKIEMLIRGICCLQAGVPGYTENIRIYSIVGRFLEHSRIYIFGSTGKEKVYISSADFMTRNTLRRVEVAAPVYSEEIRTRLLEMFRTLLRDNSKARLQVENGIYTKVINNEPPMNAQEAFYREAYAAAGTAE